MTSYSGRKQERTSRIKPKTIETHNSMRQQDLWARKGDKRRVAVSLRNRIYDRIVAFSERQHIKPSFELQLIVLVDLAQMEKMEGASSYDTHSRGVAFAAENLTHRTEACSACSLGPCISKDHCRKLIGFPARLLQSGHHNPDTDPARF